MGLVATVHKVQRIAAYRKDAGPGVKGLIAPDVFGDVRRMCQHPGAKDDQFGCPFIGIRWLVARSVKIDARVELGHAWECSIF